MELKALIVDDEFIARKTLQAMLEEHCKDVNLVASVSSVNAAEKSIKEHKPDIVFLDIEMPEHNGFELLNRFKDFDFEVIFTTAHEEYAVDAFRASCIDYLLKPIHSEHLLEAIKKYKERAMAKDFKVRQKLLLENLKTPKLQIEKMGIVTKDGIHILTIADIIYVKSCSTYSEVYTTTDPMITVSKRLKDLNALTNNSDFFRAHRSYIINLNHCKQYVRTDEQIKMINDDWIPLSSSSKPFFINIFKED
jgi:two-component system LytT family response regulator